MLGVGGYRIPIDWIVPFRLRCGRIHWSYISYFFWIVYNDNEPYSDYNLQKMYKDWEMQYQSAKAEGVEVNAANPFYKWVILFEFNSEKAEERKTELRQEMLTAEGERLQLLEAEVERLEKREAKKQLLRKELAYLKRIFERMVEFRNALNRMEDMIYNQNVEDDGGESRYPDPGGWWHNIHHKYHLSNVEHDKLLLSRTPLRNDGEVSGDRVK
ncbi:MAG: hypothetical protein Q9184_003530 [Pyrenodesmia sp. 2 TL-2023]